MYPEEMFVESVEAETFFGAQIVALVCRRNHDDKVLQSVQEGGRMRPHRLHSELRCSEIVRTRKR